MAASATATAGDPINYLGLVYGSVAVGYKPDHYLDNPTHSTHRWTFYVRPAETGKDLKLVVSKVVFKLHPTCTHPVVECAAPPYETSQLGWGEFPCTIEVHFRNDAASATFVHQLRLHTTGAPTSKPLVSEQYDEVVFGASSSFVLGALLEYHASTGVVPVGDYANYAQYWKRFSETSDLQLIARAHAYIKQELEAAVLEYEHVEAEYLKKQQQQQQQQAAIIPEAHPQPAASPPPLALTPHQLQQQHAFFDDAPPKVYAVVPPPPTLQQLQMQQQQQHQLAQQQQLAMQQQQHAGASSSRASSHGKKDGSQPAKKKGRPTLQEPKPKAKKQTAAQGAVVAGAASLPPAAAVPSAAAAAAAPPKPKAPSKAKAAQQQQQGRGQSPPPPPSSSSTTTTAAPTLPPPAVQSPPPTA